MTSTFGPAQTTPFLHDSDIPLPPILKNIASHSSPESNFPINSMHPSVELANTQYISINEFKLRTQILIELSDCKYNSD